MSKLMTFLHLTDLHLAPAGQLVEGIDPVRQMQRVMARIEHLDISPAFIVVSGDLTENGSEASYEVVKEVLHGLCSEETPVLLGLGNHDDRAMFRRVILGEEGTDLQDAYYFSQLIDGLRVIMLDSVIPGHPWGEVGAAQLGWLEEQLQMPAPQGNVIVLHHPCRLAGPARHYPAFILRDAAALEAIVARYRDRILAVLAGHTHQANSAPFSGILHVTAPAVLRQLDFFAGEHYSTVPLSGFHLCQLEDGGLIVHPVLLP